MIPITRVSAVPISDRYRAPVGTLHTLDFRKARQAVQRAFQRQGWPVVFGGIDISLNEDIGKRWVSYWQLHVYALVVGASASEVRGALARLYPADDRAPRPLVVSQCHDLAKAVSYVIKPYFSRRVSYDHKKTGRQHNWICRLRNHELRELALFLGQYGLEHRYILIGCHRIPECIKATAVARRNILFYEP